MLFEPSAGALPAAYQPIQFVVLSRPGGVEYVNVTDEPAGTEVAEAVSPGVVGAAGVAVADAFVLAAFAAEPPCTAQNAAKAVTAMDTPRTLMPRRALRRASGERSAMVESPRFARQT
jgi:hypothetical protein